MLIHITIVEINNSDNNIVLVPDLNNLFNLRTATTSQNRTQTSGLITTKIIQVELTPEQELELEDIIANKLQDFIELNSKDKH